MVRYCCAAVILATLASCVATEEKSFHHHVIGERALHADMQMMANSLLNIASATSLDVDPAANQQQIVLAELDRIEKIASAIGGDDIVTNYSVINRYMGSFLYDVNLAREFARQEPPNLVPANRLMQSCLSCHSSF